jgi:hypothetical protein
MFEYPKINTIFKRNDQTKKIILGTYSQPEFEYLAQNQWAWTEKIDGTNCRIHWNQKEKIILFAGRTQNAQLPKNLSKRLQEIFTVEKLITLFPDVPVTFFGEGFGNKIQEPMGSYYNSKDVDFILFDITVGRWWLERNSVDKIAQDLNILAVPVVGEGNLNSAMQYAQENNSSIFGKFSMEGIVLRPKIELFARNGSRIITKLKHRDFL